MNLHSALYVKKKSKVSGVGGRLYTLCWEFYSFKFLKRKDFRVHYHFCEDSYMYEWMDLLTLFVLDEDLDDEMLFF